MNSVAGYKINIQKSVVNYLKKIEETISFTTAIKNNKILRNKFNQGGERFLH